MRDISLELGISGKKIKLENMQKKLESLLGAEYSSMRDSIDKLKEEIRIMGFKLDNHNDKLMNGSCIR